MKIMEWLSSKKAKGTISTQALVIGFIMFVLWFVGGDLEKFKAVLDACQVYILGLVGAGAAGVISQGMADSGKESAKIQANPRLAHKN